MSQHVLPDRLADRVVDRERELVYAVQPLEKSVSRPPGPNSVAVVRRREVPPKRCKMSAVSTFAMVTLKAMRRVRMLAGGGE